MPKNLDDIYKKLDANNKASQKENNQLIRLTTNIEKDNNQIIKEIKDIKKEVSNIAFKVDTMLEILNSFTIMLSEDDDNIEDEFDTDETWVPKEDDFWENDNDE